MPSNISVFPLARIPRKGQHVARQAASANLVPVDSLYRSLISCESVFSLLLSGLVGRLRVSLDSSMPSRIAHLMTMYRIHIGSVHTASVMRIIKTAALNFDSPFVRVSL